MAITSPIFALIALPLTLVVIVRARRIIAWIPRTLLQLAAVFLLLGVAGVDLRWDRPLKIAVLVDVSPSTRGATFRDPKSVIARLTPLLNRQSYTLHYFGDGLQASADELPIALTRLEAPDADAIVLMSDGRFTTPGNLPPVYPVIDPAMDHPIDGRIANLALDGSHVIVQASITGEPRELRLSGASVSRAPLPVGRPVIEADVGAKAQSVSAALIGADRWPENDRMSLSTLPATPVERWSIGVAIPGFAPRAPSRRPLDLSNFLPVSSIVLATDAPISDVVADRLKQFVNQLGGTLVCVGSPNHLPVLLRSIAPLSAQPPTPASDWTVLLDASGSMGATDATGHSRWMDALAAAERAVGRLAEDQRVTVMSFARSPKVIASRVKPIDAIEQLRQLADMAPAGPTGLRAALEAIAKRTDATPTRLLLFSDADADLGDVSELTRTLNASRVALFALTTTPSDALQRLATATGGRLLINDDPARWAEALQSLATAAGESAVQKDAITVAGKGPIEGMTLHTDRRWQSWSKQGAEVLAEVKGEPLIATWQAGAGRVVSIAADIGGDELAEIAKRLEQSAADPRFAVTWDEMRDRVGIVAADSSGPMNGLHPILDRNNVQTPFEQTAPGEYEAPLHREPISSAGVIRIGDHVIARRSIAGRYAQEFDAIGNDRTALTALAKSTGGAVIEPGDAQAIPFARATELWSTTPACALASVVLLSSAIVLLHTGKRT